MVVFTRYPDIQAAQSLLIASSLTRGIFTFARFYIRAPAKYIFKVIPDFEFLNVAPGRYFVRLHAIATRAPITAVRAGLLIAGSIHP